MPSWLSQSGVRRPAGWTLVVTAAMFALMGSPAYASPTPTPPNAPGVAAGAGMVPDAGSAPVANAPLTLPGATVGVPASTRPPAIGPLAARIMAETAAVEQLGEQLKQLDIDATEAQRTVDATQQVWQQAQQNLAVAQAAADAAAGAAYRSATELGPFGSYAPDLHDLGVLAPGLAGQMGSPGGGAQTGHDLIEAQRAEAAARTAHQSAVATAQATAARRDAARASFTRRSAALAVLQTRNQAQLQAAEAARDAYEQGLGVRLGAGSAAAGTKASAQALGAVRFALSQIGKPYVWGAEGPNSYDCSGLVLASYRYVGVSVPRVANEQYHATTPVAVNQLLPGDLVFFATNKSDWRTIHHVGIYVGDGKMVHAPHTGDVVKVSPVWWSEFFGATRVVGGVHGSPGGNSGTGPDGSSGNSGGTGTQQPGGSTKPKPRPSTPTPGGTRPAPGGTTPPPGPTPTPTDSTPAPTPSDSGTPTPTPTDSTGSTAPSDPATSPTDSGTTSAPATTDPTGTTSSSTTSGSDGTSTAMPSASTTTPAPSTT